MEVRLFVMEVRPIKGLITDSLTHPRLFGGCAEFFAGTKILLPVYTEQEGEPPLSANIWE
jgi:hypothetical protein